ncbi:cyanoexosortase A system-associated protein [Oscillatoriales cyanobacterium LEGE 11467]|uniref:Cyanoexosortase A system-associated protein n=1 Tax=Zarconia navalis LEGE 11467 TaxID=1828826 RepID=A0A928Z822_9CYAN|nr:cyanoexosortase A system-associated protein [Zarconia navalis]MBE9040089.1 cyanoexosortase A system-associated protein [Zarconia navalis LEGE 11467]
MDELKPSATPSNPLWKKLRLPIAIFELGLVSLLFVRILFDPALGQRKPLEFPPSVPLTNWESSQSERLKGIATSDNEYEYGSTILGGMRYQYTRDRLPLDIDLRYVVDTKGEVDVFLRKHSSLASSTTPVSLRLANQSGVGSYALLADGDRAYLSACINPRGNSTYTREEYRHNQDIYDAQLGRVPAWLFRREKWRDDRCLWTLMSMPLSESDPEATQKILEQAWFEWYGRWSANFPPL